jgi:Arc/MetJ-type ribon-helix-helix transcriptional regulator
MTTITISLSEPLTAYLQEQVIAGGYNTPSEYIQA